jgi:hypothetical protein
MDPHRTPPGDAASADAATPFAAADPALETPAPVAAETPARVGWIEGHLPDRVDPLVPRDPGTALAETRRMRHDGWTPEKQRRFLERFAECGIVLEACEAVGMSARSAYNLRDRDPLFAAGWDAAQAMARPRLADEAYSRALNGVVDRIYKDGMIVAERHRYDNRLTMSVLARLDARLDRAEEKGAPHLALVARWDEYLAALGEDRREDGLAMLAPAGAEGKEKAEDRELHEVYDGEDPDMGPDEDCDPHQVWEDEDGWWTDYPPPAGFAGYQEGAYGEDAYRRALSSEEQAVVDAEIAEDDAEMRARAEAQRAAWFAPDVPEAQEARNPRRTRPIRSFAPPPQCTNRATTSR